MPFALKTPDHRPYDTAPAAEDLLAAFVDGKGHRRQYRYDDHGQMTEIISAKGHPVVRNSYDKEYRVSRQIVGESEEYSFEYEDGKTTVTDAYGNAETHHYDDDLRLVRLEHKDGTEERFEYDADLNRTGYTDQAGAAWKWRSMSDLCCPYLINHYRVLFHLQLFRNEKMFLV
ncbi:hypothetical protein VU06_01215 [Desulfobulbus sp. F3]|nr:hypothetical protein [Desulfobulbus sp. F3]